MNIRSIFDKIKAPNLNKDVPTSTKNSYYTNYFNAFRRTNDTQIYNSILDKISTSFAQYRYFEIDINGDKINSNLNNLLNFRPNPHQTPYEFLFTIAKQREMYGNAIIIPKYSSIKYTDKNNVVRRRWVIDSLNVSDNALYDYGFGYGYESETLYLIRRETATGELEYIDYQTVIHLRKDPNNIFTGDKYTNLDKLKGINRVIDSQLDTYINQMSENGKIKGIFTIGEATGGIGAMVDNDGKKAKYAELENRIATANNGILVLDQQEKFEKLTNIFETVSADELKQIMDLGYTLFGVSEAVVNGTASAEEMEIFYRDTIKPIRDAFKEELQYKVLGLDKYRQGRRIIAPRNPMEYSAVENLADTIYKLSHIYTVNEIRENLGIAKIQGGDELMTNLNFSKQQPDDMLSSSALKGGDNNEKNSKGNK